MTRLYKYNCFILLVLLLHVVCCLKIVTFGDSTIDNTKCNTDLYGVTFPPTPPYSEFIRFSGKWTWVDYLEKKIEDIPDIEIISCTCGYSLLTQDYPFDPLETGNVVSVPGLLNQIESCDLNNKIKNLAQDEKLIAVVQSGGNDFMESIVTKIVPTVTPQKFSESVRQAIEKLSEIGFDKIYFGNTNQPDYAITPFLRQIFPEDEFNEAFQFMQVLIDTFDEVLSDMKEEGYCVCEIPIGQFFVDIKKEAEKQGLEASKPCINPLTLWKDIQFFENCTEFDERMWFDGLHLADWGHQQYADHMLDLMDLHIPYILEQLPELEQFPPLFKNFFQKIATCP